MWLPGVGCCCAGAGGVQDVGMGGGGGQKAAPHRCQRAGYTRGRVACGQGHTMAYLKVASGHVLHGCLDAAEGEEGAAFEHHGAGHKQRICGARHSKERSLWSAQGPATQLL